MSIKKNKLKVRVLVVDDSALFRSTLVQALSSMANIEVAGEAADAFEARDKINDLKPDVLVMDVVMPKMDGRTFLRELMEQYPLPCIMMSGTESEESVLEAGAADFIKKPRSPAEFKTFSTILGTKIILAASRPVHAASRPKTAAAEVKDDGLVPLGTTAKSSKVAPNMPLPNE
ncbi:MAG: response regulator, partial [Oscillospiraceae bacterium]|nr:response regulator [Oscillospiraceae bacterium]